MYEIIKTLTDKFKEEIFQFYTRIYSTESQNFKIY